MLEAGDQKERRVMRLDERVESVLMDHAAGNLSPSAAFVVDAHLLLNVQARRAYGCYEATGGALLDAIEPTAMSGALPVPEFRAPARVAGETGASAGLGSLVSSLGNGGWQKGLSGFLTKPVSGVDARLLRLQEGRQAPDHGHNGLELTLVLCGVLEDEHGRYHRGDLVVHDEDTEHQPRAGLGGDCICLIAEEAPVRLKGPLAWAINPFMQLGRPRRSVAESWHGHSL